jgi:hypothetical protein
MTSTHLRGYPMGSNLRTRRRVVLTDPNRCLASRSALDLRGHGHCKYGEDGIRPNQSMIPIPQPRLTASAEAYLKVIGLVTTLLVTWVCLCSIRRAAFIGRRGIRRQSQRRAASIRQTGWQNRLRLSIGADFFGRSRFPSFDFYPAKAFLIYLVGRLPGLAVRLVHRISTLAMFRIRSEGGGPLGTNR